MILLFRDILYARKFGVPFKTSKPHILSVLISWRKNIFSDRTTSTYFSIARTASIIILFFRKVGDDNQNISIHKHVVYIFFRQNNIYNYIVSCYDRDSFSRGESMTRNCYPGTESLGDQGRNSWHYLLSSMTSCFPNM